MDEKEFRRLCVARLIEWSMARHGRMLAQDEVYVVWMCKALQNNKALLSTTAADGRYYEFTYNGDKDELYMDVYGKEMNIVFNGVFNGAQE